MRMTKACLVILVVALAACALLAQSAAATGTVLCKSNTELCTPANRYLPPTALSAALQSKTQTTLETSLGNVTCQATSLAGQFVDESTVVKGEATSLSFGTCASGAQSCTLTSVHTPYASELTHTEAVGGTFTLANAGAGKPGISVQCGLLISCTLVGEPKFALKGGTPATMVASKTPLSKESGLICPATASLTSSLAVSEPASLFVSNGETALCEKNETTCAAANRYPSQTAVEAALNPGSIAKFEIGATTTECSSSTLSGETVGEKAQPLTLSAFEMSVGGCNHSCSVTVFGVGEDPQLRASGAGNGRFTVLTPEFYSTCGAEECIYRKPSAILDFQIGTNTQFVAFEEPLDLFATIKGTCAKTMLWSGFYNISSPSPVFLTG
jgi:hypothetical protein